MPIKILYVEDELSLAHIVTDTLVSSGYKVSLVTDGSAVVEEAHQFKPDICLLDVMLPSIDGFTLGKQLSKELPGLPIIFLTAKSQQEDVIKGFKSGGNDFIKKPFSIEELMLRIDNIISLMGSSKTEKQHQSFKIGSYLFNPHSQQLIRGSKYKELSYREVEVLDYFVKNLHGVVQKKDMLIEIWGDDSFYNSRNLDVYMRKLRSYLEDDQGVSILTLRGVGYKLIIDDSSTQ